MKTREELINRYEELLKEMVESKDQNKMNVFLDAEKWVFKDMASKNPELADSWLSHLEASNWKNYLSEREMLNISKRTANQDGSKGFHWNFETLKKAIVELGEKMEEYPYYNQYALATVMNIVYSDHAYSIALDLDFKTPKDTPNGTMAMSCYRKAVEKLKDIDNPYFVRKYFGDKMYDTSPI